MYNNYTTLLLLKVKYKFLLEESYTFLYAVVISVLGRGIYNYVVT